MVRILKKKKETPLHPILDIPHIPDSPGLTNTNMTFSFSFFFSHRNSISPLATKIPNSVVAPLLDKLTVIKLENSVDNSIPSLALRNAISALPRPVPGIPFSKEVTDTYNTISRVLIPRILGFSIPSNGPSQFSSDPKGILDRADPSAEAVDVLIEVVRCYGPLLQPLEVEKLQDVVVQLMERPATSSPVKKRAVVALAILGPYLTNDVLQTLAAKIHTTLKNSKLSPVMRRLYINITGSLARSIPHQFGEYVPQLVPLILGVLSQEELQAQLDAISEGNDQLMLEFTEVHEAALVSLEAFLASCGAEMRQFTDDTIAACLRYLKFDPNYAVDDDEEMDQDNEDEDELEDDD